MSNAVSSPVRRLVVALTLIAGVTSMKPAAFAQAVTSVGSFEIDGNTACTQQGEPIDWACPNAGSPPPSVTPFSDPTGSSDNRFSGKWNDPTTFSCATQSVPNKDDITAGDIAFRTLNGDQFVYVDWTRVFGNGSAFVSYVFSQSTATYPNAPCVPQRSDGDIVINYTFTQGGATPTISAFKWVGTATAGSFVPLATGSQNSTWAAAVSGPNPLYGEGALNLTQTIGNIDCSRFSSVYIATRSSAEDNANVADITTTKPVGTILCDDHQFCTIDTCAPGDPNADPVTQCVHSANPCHESPDVTCTADSCQEGTDGNGTCVHTPVNGNCNDGFSCTTDTCSPGAPGSDPTTGCLLTPVNSRCNDSNVCTNDTCNPSATGHDANGCVFTPNSAPCDDGSFCDGTDTCANGSCSVHSGDPCAGGAECNNVCNEQAKNCLVPGGTSCTDDGSICTLDQCNGQGSCVHTPGNVGTVCRAQNGICDVAETCDGVHAACPADGFASSAQQCRASAGPCDVAEFCTGTSGACPADGKSTAVCRPAAGPCDVAESCDGTHDACPTDQFKQSTVVCRAAHDACDVAENCTGSSAGCPADAFAPATTACASDDNGCTTDHCDGSVDQCKHDPVQQCQPTSLVKKVRNITDNPQGDFDTDTTGDAGETVEFELIFTKSADFAAQDGSTISDPLPPQCAFISCDDGVPNNEPDCVTDGPPVTTLTFDVSGVAAGGTKTFTFQCQLDQTFPQGTTDVTNKATAHVSDTGGTHTTDSNESTVVVTVTCPASCDDQNPCTTDSCTDSRGCVHTAAPQGTLCRAAADICDVAEFCDGTSTQCPTDGFVNAGTECRASAGACDPAETCTGNSAACPSDAKSTAVCRASAGPCDVAESCDGVHNDCPADVLMGAGTVCRASAGVCDLTETCTGTSADCPDDVKSTGVCRPSAGPCDVAESCDGMHDDCPADVLVGAGTICRASAGDCDLPESCTGTSVACPADAKSTALCRSATGPCDVAESCNGLDNSCPPDVFQPTGTPCEDNDHIACTEDLCDGNNLCVSTPKDSRCDDQNACTKDECIVAQHGCVNTPLPVQPNSEVAGDSNAYGVSLRLGGQTLIPPTPDTDDSDPSNELLNLPLSPVAVVDLLKTEDSNTSGTDSNGPTKTTSAKATTAEVQLLENPPGTFLVAATAIHAQSNCHADGATAGSDSEGSVLEGVVVAGQNLDTIRQPTTLTFVDPILHTTTTVSLLEQIKSGAKAGQPEPESGGVFASGLEVNGIHVHVADGSGNEIADAVVAHAKCTASFAPTCAVPPSVSGSGYVVGVTADENIVDAAHTLVEGKVGSVMLPSTGGIDDATLKQIGPITDGGSPLTTLVESNTAFSHTEGKVDNGDNSASSQTHTEVQRLRVLDTGSSPTNPLVAADVARAECLSSSDSSGSSSTGKTILLRPAIAGTPICLPLVPGDTCEPAPNTDLPGAPIGTLIRLNEQYCDGDTPTPGAAPSCSGANSSGITVNAIHLFVIGEANPLGLPVGADVIISDAHCDSKKLPSSQ